MDFDLIGDCNVRTLHLAFYLRLMQQFLSTDGELLHVWMDVDEIENGRLDLCPESAYIQVAVIATDETEKILRPHSMLDVYQVTTKIQEAWIIISGAVFTTLYDNDKRLLAEITLQPGHILVSLGGGHGFKTTTQTRIIECKSGYYSIHQPYKYI